MAVSVSSAGTTPRGEIAITVKRAIIEINLNPSNTVKPAKVGILHSFRRFSLFELVFQRVIATFTPASVGSIRSCTYCRGGLAEVCVSSVDTTRREDTVTTVRRASTGTPPSPSHTVKLVKVG